MADSRTWRRDLHELIFRTFFRVAAAGGAGGQTLVSRLYFGWLYRRPDPWKYASSPYELAKYERTLATLRGNCASRALEAGCSEGAFTEMLLREGLARTIVGVDVSETALARARARCAAFPGAEFVRANVSSEAPSGSFDLIICAEILYYIGPRAGRACAILGERLAPQGRLVAVHSTDRAALLHAPWVADPRLVHEQRILADDDARPYTIDVFRRVENGG
jgi:SAM-dependent methyltransferase